MKQNITKKQYIELSWDGKRELKKWRDERGYEQLLSIGQLIEFLGDDWVNDVYYYPTSDTGIEPRFGKRGQDWFCDELWDYAKEKLEK